MESLLRNAPPAFRARATVALLKPGADRFTPLELIERVSTSQVPAERLAADDARKVRDAFLAYIDARAENARERRRGPALYHHLREATEILSKFAEISADGMQELPAAALEEGTVTMRGPWIPPETRDEPIPYLCLPYGWTLHGDSLVAAGKKDAAVRVSLHELHGDSIALPKNGGGASVLLVSGHFVLNGENVVWIKNAEGGEWQRFEMKSWFGAVPAGKRVFVGWSAPPRYYGALERSPELAKNPEFVESLNTSLSVWDAENGSFQKIKPGKATPFLKGDRFKFERVFALPSGRLVVCASDFLKRDGWDYPETYVADDVTGTSFSQLFTIRSHHWLDAWGDGTDDILLLSAAHGETVLECSPFTPDEALRFDVKRRRFERLFVNDSPLARRRTWEFKAFPVPRSARWELPQELKAPEPGIKTQWLRVFPDKGRLFAFVASWRPGRESVPGYSLYCFETGRKLPLRLPLRFEFPAEALGRIDLLRKAGHHPGSLAELDPHPYATPGYLAIATAFGVFRISWTDLSLELRKHRRD